MDTAILKADNMPVEIEDQLYRRVPKKPSFFTVNDLITGETKLSPAAFNYSPRDKEDGLSVYVERLLEELGIPSVNLCKDWTTHGVARFAASLILRRGGEVHICEDELDPILGKAHAAIPLRDDWRELRLDIISSCEFFPADPECSV
ncbi:hypothetical protein ACIA5H_05690 [Nocardia sp. NPDC051900]|uniref:hypothetical protein n=1 Tax=Nocardia sp. NPDC051900 TaxID=3364326 RepID=UPI00379D02AB